MIWDDLAIFWDTLSRYFNDFVVFLSWFFYILRELLTSLTLPIRWIFYFLKSFTLQAFSTPETPEIIATISSWATAFFNQIPYSTIIRTLIGTSLLIIIAIGTLKTLAEDL